jgi:hypothetical protein
VPGTDYYSITSTLDSSGSRFFFEPASNSGTPKGCNSAITGTLASGKLFLPSKTAATKIEATNICRTGITNINEWEVQGGRIVGIGCSTGSLITLVNSADTQACLVTSDNNYDANCATYSYDGAIYTCESCKSGFTRFKTTIVTSGSPDTSTAVVYDCLAGADIIPYCT